MENLENNLELDGNMDVEEYEPEIYTLVDEDGVQNNFEIVDELEHDGNTYFALIPYFENEEDFNEEEVEDQVVILKLSVVDGEEMMVTIDSDEEYETVGQLFFERFHQIMEDFDHDFSDYN